MGEWSRSRLRSRWESLKYSFGQHAQARVVNQTIDRFVVFATLPQLTTILRSARARARARAQQ